MDFVLNTVQTSHQQRCETQVRVSCWVREAGFNTLGFSAGYVRNTDRSRAVASRVSQHYRGFVAWNQTLVRVGRSVTESVQRTGVLDDTADVEQSHFAQTRVGVTGELVNTAFGERLVNVHA